MHSADTQAYLDSVKFIQEAQETFISGGTVERNTLVAGLSSSATSPKKEQLNYSGTITSNTLCPSIYLSAIAYNSSGTVVSEMANTKNATKKCTVSNIETGLTSGKYHVTYYGIIEAPADYTPNPGIVESTKNVTVK